MPDDERSNKTCPDCGAWQVFAAGSISKLSSPGYGDLYRCEQCGTLTIYDRRPSPPFDKKDGEY